MKNYFNVIIELVDLSSKVSTGEPLCLLISSMREI